MTDHFINKAATLGRTIESEQDTLRALVRDFTGTLPDDLPASLTVGCIPLYTRYRALLPQALFSREFGDDNADRVLQTMVFARILAFPAAVRMSKCYIQSDLAAEIGLDDTTRDAGQDQLLTLTPAIIESLNERPEKPGIGYVIEVQECLFDCRDTTVGILVDGNGRPVDFGFFTKDDSRADRLAYFAVDPAQYGMDEIVPAHYLNATVVTEAALSFRERRAEHRDHTEAVRAAADFLNAHSLETWSMPPQNTAELSRLSEIDAKLALAPSAALLTCHYLALMLARRIVIDLAALVPGPEPEEVGQSLTLPMLIRKTDHILQLYDMNDTVAAIIRAQHLPLLYPYLSDTHLLELRELIDLSADVCSQTCGEDFS